MYHNNHGRPQKFRKGEGKPKKLAPHKDKKGIHIEKNVAKGLTWRKMAKRPLILRKKIVVLPGGERLLLPPPPAGAHDNNIGIY